MTDYKKKLIEVALPLEAINDASAYDKMPGIGPHPKGLHKWWAPLPLPCARAFLFASLVDDPSSRPATWPTEHEQSLARQRLFELVRRLVAKDHEVRDAALEQARNEMADSCPEGLPKAVDPFCGSGAIPVEARRLGMTAHASDLNPVAVLMNRALIEIPPKFADLPPVNPDARTERGSFAWADTQGLAEDVRYYGRWMQARALAQIGHHYPKIRLPEEHGGGEADAIAWLWARSVKCPNPACGARMPLVRSFGLSSKRGKQFWIEPIVDAETTRVRFEVRSGVGAPPEGTKQRGRSRCLFCGTDNISDADLRHQASAHGITAQLMAVVAQGPRRRVYVTPGESVCGLVDAPAAEWLLQPLPENPRWFSPPGYGLFNYRDLFTDRQLLALTTFSNLVSEAREAVRRDAEQAWAEREDDVCDVTTASDYADAVATYLAFAVDRCADFNNSFCRWVVRNEKVMNLFARQAIPMVWDFAEANIIGDTVGGWSTCLEYVAKCLQTVPLSRSGSAVVTQLDAAGSSKSPNDFIVSTDPPYYDNIGYADLSDFFYVWLRHSLAGCYPDLFGTILVPKTQELIASPYRFDGDSEKASDHFETGFLKTFTGLRESMDDRFPMTVYYAFKQSEAGDGDPGLAGATGWATMLQSLVSAGFQVTATWPVRASQSWRIISMGTNALASYIVIACRPRGASAPLATRQEFVQMLRLELPAALRALQEGNVAPVDLAQAAIGPGMAVFSRFAKVMEADGSRMKVNSALALINQALDALLAEQEGEFDADTRWAIGWFEQFGLDAGDFGVAETLCTAKNCSVKGLVDAGILEARAGKVRLLRRDELHGDWDPTSDNRLTVWEMTQHLIWRLDEGEGASAALVRQLGSYADVARDLAYRLFVICERKKWSQEGQAYNGLVIAWPQLQRLAAAELGSAGPAQVSFEV